MCVIGNVYDSNSIISFKQCDQYGDVIFYPPQLKQGKEDIKYIGLKRNNSDGCWAGINNYGVTFTAADAYLDNPNNTKNNTLKGPGDSVLEQYEKIVSEHKTAKEAAEAMSNFYVSKFGDPDILMICDKKERYFIETHTAVKKEIQVIPLNDLTSPNFFVSTNHFRFIHGGVTYSENHSTYLRLNRAESILQKETSLKGAMDVLCDQYYGPSVLSICREYQKLPVPIGESAYKTMATAIFQVSKEGDPIIYWQINGNPKTNRYSTGIIRADGFEIIE